MIGTISGELIGSVCHFVVRGQVVYTRPSRVHC